MKKIFFGSKETGGTASTPSEMKRAADAKLESNREKSTKDGLVNQLETYQNERANAISQGDALKELKFSALVAEVKLEIASRALDDPLLNDEAKARALDAEREAKIRALDAQRELREALRQAEYDRRKAEYDQEVAVLERKIAEAEAKIDNVSLSESRRNAAEADWAKFRKRLNDLKWDEADERAKIAERFPDPTQNPILTSIELVKVNWAQISDQVSTFPFRLNHTLEDDESHYEVLGPLYKPGSKWPVVVAGETLEKTIDMRLLSRKVFDPAGDELRPAARVLSSRLLLGTGTVALVAVPGIGKSSALIDIGREHYVIYIQSSTPSDLPFRGPMARRSREFDKNFVSMVQDLDDRMLKGQHKASLIQNWNVALHRAMVELVARVLQLVRLFRELGANLHPWVFAVHQLAGSQEFVARFVKQLKNADASSLDDILAAAMQELAPIFSAECRFVVSIDEMELAAHELKERFVLPTSQKDPAGETKMPEPRGILSPLIRAVSDFSSIALWSLVLAGTGTSEESVTNLKTDLGKLSLNSIIRDAPTFPLTQASDVICLLGRLKISEELQDLLAAGLESSPLHQASRDSPENTDAENVKYLLEDYVFPARFRMLCAVFEYIKQKLSVIGSADIILLEAIRTSIDQHKNGLNNLLRIRLDRKHPYRLHESEVSKYLDYLLQVTISVRLTDGSTPILVPSNINNSSISDLTRLGIAASTETSHSKDPMTVRNPSTSTYSAFRICERFVVEVLMEFFENPEVLKRAQTGKAQELLSMLQNVLTSFGPNISFKGNIVERLILERLVVLAGKYTKVTDLPFFPRESPHVSWEDWEFTPTRLEQYRPDRSTSEILSSQAAPTVVYAPETVCRPDGIVMLRLKAGGGDTASAVASTKNIRRAISVGVAVYTDSVPRDKVESQFWSTDLSRAFLNKDHEAYDATFARRQEWVKQGLHETVAIRVHVFLPRAAAASSFASQLFQRETMVSPTKYPQPLSKTRRGSNHVSQHDIIVNVDRSNIQMILGEPGEDKTIANLYRLIDVATGLEKSFT